MEDFFSKEIGSAPTATAAKDFFSEEISAEPKANAPKEEWETYYKNTVEPKTDIIGDVGAVGKHFANQFLLNAPRSIANTVGKPIDFEAKSPLMNVAAHVAGVAGAVSNPIGVVSREAGLGMQALGGAVQGALYSPNENFGDIRQRGTQAIGGAILNPVVAKAGEVVGNAIGSITKPISERISDIISGLYNKAIKPTTRQGNFTKLQANNANIEIGVRAIVGNKPNLSLGEEEHSLPQNLEHHLEAIGQTKDEIFNKYNAMQEKATGKGVTINGSGLAQELQPIIESKSIDVVSPSTKKYAVDLFERLQNAGDMTPKELQEIIKGFNGRLKAYYRNPSPDSYGATAVDALIANNARKSLDDAISGASGKGYQTLKNTYGALSSMEKDAARAAQRASNYQNKGLLDFSDIFTGEQMVRGILTLNPAEFTTGLAGRAIKGYYKYLNNPNAVIAKMYNGVDRLTQAEMNPSMIENLQGAVSNVRKRSESILDALRQREPSLGLSGKVGEKPNMVKFEPKQMRSTLTPEEAAAARTHTTPDEASTISQWHKLGDVRAAVPLFAVPHAMKQKIANVENGGKAEGDWAQLTPVVFQDLRQKGLIDSSVTIGKARKDPKMYEEVVSKYLKRMDDFGIPDNVKWLWWYKPALYKKTGGDVDRIQDPKDRNIMKNRMKNVGQ